MLGHLGVKSWTRRKVGSWLDLGRLWANVHQMLGECRHPLRFTVVFLLVWDIHTYVVVKLRENMEFWAPRFSEMNPRIVVNYFQTRLTSEHVAIFIRVQFSDLHVIHWPPREHASN